jgi:hypothetical protein
MVRFGKYEYNFVLNREMSAAFHADLESPEEEVEVAEEATEEDVEVEVEEEEESLLDL